MFAAHSTDAKTIRECVQQHSRTKQQQYRKLLVSLSYSMLIGLLEYQFASILYAIDARTHTRCTRHPRTHAQRAMTLLALSSGAATLSALERQKEEDG
jgi:hypothetical protein